MAIKKYSYHYGHGCKEFELDSDRVLKEVRMAEVEPLKDIKSAVLDAIYHPIGTKPINELIKPGQTVAFICNDPTRVANSFDFMPVLINEMNKLGVRDQDMRIVFALGTTRLMTEEEMREAWARRSRAESGCTTATPNVRRISSFSARPRSELGLDQQACLRRRPRHYDWKHSPPLFRRLRRRAQGDFPGSCRHGNSQGQSQLYARPACRSWQAARESSL